MANLFGFLFFLSFICLIIGLIKPAAFSRFIKGEITRKRIAKIFGIATIASFILLSLVGNDSNDNQSTVPVLENGGVIENSEGLDPTLDDVDANPISTQAKNETVSTSTKTVSNQNTVSVQSETVSQKNAVAKAKSYLSFTAFSHDGLVSQLEFEQFSHADAVYGADNSGANWNEQAAKKAESYLKFSAFSRGGLIDQLKFDKFTQAQAEYGADAVGL